MVERPIQQRRHGRKTAMQLWRSDYSSVAEYGSPPRSGRRAASSPRAKPMHAQNLTRSTQANNLFYRRANKAARGGGRASRVAPTCAGRSPTSAGRDAAPPPAGGALNPLSNAFRYNLPGNTYC
ncbi:hypothetical protein EVAR_47788_1 [Eumeta japonica]|uniref:Uncharacterized protein n=1 Tax=Eumeta variegata TaxID=151549 RepID=A0A4C1XY85_EUMVA|nr:hypothetical protein EVAR_47788_1 [Eumeta japonica]